MEAERKTYEHRYPSRRSVVYSDRGMVCTSQALAAQTGLDMLKRGGNAVDAAVATAIAMTVLEPTSNGLGSDAFAIVWSKEEKKLFGLNGSGWAPRLLTRWLPDHAGPRLGFRDRTWGAVGLGRTASPLRPPALPGTLRTGHWVCRKRRSHPARHVVPVGAGRRGLRAVSGRAGFRALLRNFFGRRRAETG